MEANDNKRLVQQVYAAMAEGDSAPFVALLADDVRWIVLGATAWSGSYAGKAAVQRELLGPLVARLARPYRARLRRLVAEDDLVVAELEGDNETRTGARYDNRYCFVLRLAGGQVREVTEYGDTELVRAALGDRVPLAAR